MTEIKPIVKNSVIVIIILFLAMIVIGAAYCVINPNFANNRETQNDNNTPDNNPHPKSYSVRYEVLGSGESVSITYRNQDGGTSQESKVYLKDLPWNYNLRSMYKGD